MSRLPKSLELDRPGIERLKVSKELKVFLRRLVDRLEEKYKLLREHAESGGYQTAHWRIIEDSSENLKHQYRANKDSAWSDRAPKLESSP